MKKRIISLLTALFFLLGIIAPVAVFAAEAIDSVKAESASEFTDDMQDYKDIPSGTSMAELDNWKISTSYAGKSATLTTDPEDSTNIVAKYSTDSTLYTTAQAANTYLSRSFDAVSGDYLLISTSIYPTVSERWMFMIYGNASKDGTVTATGKAAIELMIESGGKLAYECRGKDPTWTNINTNTDNWNIGEWNDIDILINTAAMTFDVYTNGVKRNTEAMPLSGYITTAGDCLSALTSVSYGVRRQALTGDMYIDNLSINAISLEEMARVEAAGIVVPESISAGTQLPAATSNFNIPLTWTSNADEVEISLEGIVAVSAAPAGPVTLTAKSSNVVFGTYEVDVTVKTALETVFADAFDYTSDESISQEDAAANGWSIENEDNIAEGEGSTALIKANPEDSTDPVLDIEVLTTKNTEYNRYVNLSKSMSFAGKKYMMLNEKVRFTSSTNKFILYIQGTMVNAETNKYTRTTNLVQFSYDITNGQFAHEDYTKPNGSSTYTTIAPVDMPLNKWVDMKFVIDNANQTYNIYMDNVKINSEPIRIYRQYSGEVITGVNLIRTGANRWDGTSAHMYVDDFKIQAFDDAGAVELDMNAVSINENAGESFTLPTTGAMFGSALTWASSNTDVISISGGNASITVPDDMTEVTLTATASLGDVSETREYTVNVLGDAQRIEKIEKALTVYTLTGQKYVSKSFTPNIPYAEADDTYTITCTDSAFVYDPAANTVTITQGEEDKIVEATVTVTSDRGNSFVKTLKIYIPSKTVVTLYEDMNYPALKGASVSGASSWSVTNEEPDLSLTGAALYIEASPDDDTDLVLDTNVIRKRDSSLYGNQYATWKGNAKTAGNAIMQANIKFDNSVENQYIWYNQGTVTTSSGSSNQTLIQLFINRNGNTMQAQTKSGVVTITEEALPTNEWFNLKLELNAAENTFDVYIDNVKKNTESIPLYTQVEGGVVTAITQMQFGASRYKGYAGHMYIDDIIIRSKNADVLKTEADVLEIPETFIYDVELPTNGVYADTSISWASSKPEILSGDGKVNRIIGFGETDVKMTATISAGGESITKEFDVKVVNTPPYTIDNMVFETAEGDVTYTPVSGGKLTMLYAKKYTTENVNAKAIAAIYDSEGNLIEVSAPAAITESGGISLNMELPEADNMYACAYIWNMDNLEPLAYKYHTANVPESEVSVFTIGDSTMQSYGTLAQKQTDNTITGWAQVLGLGFDESMVKVKNHGVSGMSTRSFYNLGYIHDVYNNLKPGDYLIIQFGHNDQKTSSNQMPEVKYAPLEEEHRVETTPAVPEQYADYKTYEQWLREYAAAARMKGAYPVFATSIYRRQFTTTEVTDDNPDGMTPINSHVGYPEAMIDLAADLNVPVLDLHERTGEWLDANGYEGSLKYFLAYHGGTDNTHLTYDGAVEVANLAISEMKRIGLPIAVYAGEVPAR